MGLRPRPRRAAATGLGLSAPPPTPAWWRAFYARERAGVDLDAVLRGADPPGLRLPPGGALVVPHTRLAGSGPMLAAAARAIIGSGATRVLALGPLHGAPRDANGAVPRDLEGLLPPGPATMEEFCLDHLLALLARAAHAAGMPMPVVAPRWCCALPASGQVPGLAEARAAVAAGTVVVATVDPIHHGHGYQTPADAVRPAEAAQAWARDGILAQLGAAAAGARERLRDEARRWRSDGAAVLAVLRDLIGPWQAVIERLDLTDYSAVLGSPAPTWVASALIVLAPHDGVTAPGCLRSPGS